MCGSPADSLDGRRRPGVVALVVVVAWAGFCRAAVVVPAAVVLAGLLVGGVGVGFGFGGGVQGRGAAVVLLRAFELS